MNDEENKNSNIIDDGIDHNIYELPKDEVTDELKDKISKSKEKDLSEINNL